MSHKTTRHALSRQHPTIRSYKKDDGETVLHLAQKYASWDATPTMADLEGLSSSDPDFFFVAEIDQRIIGFVCGRESKNIPDEVLRNWKATRAASIEILAVDEKYRGRGIGTLLLEHLFSVFKEKGIDSVTLSVPAVETEAKKLYDRLGFETRAYFMKKKL